MKRNTILAALLAALAIPSLAWSDPPRPGPYLNLFVGVTVPEDRHADSFDEGGFYDDRVEFDPGINVGGSGGFDFGYVRLEAELAYKEGDISSVYDSTRNVSYGDLHGSLGAFSVMANCFVDLHNNTPVTPYFGGGIGFATLYLDDTRGTDKSSGLEDFLYDSDDDTVFAYQVGAGLEIAINRFFSLDLGYRYFATDEGDFEGGIAGTRMKFESHNGTVGFRYKF